MADGRRDDAPDWAALTDRALGAPVPVEGLSAWIVGAPRPGAPYCGRVRRGRARGRAPTGRLGHRVCVRGWRGSPARAAAAYAGGSRNPDRRTCSGADVARAPPSGDNSRMPSLIVPAPAKLNLFLHVTGRRADGRHRLETLFVALDVGDTIELAVRARRRDPPCRRLGRRPGGRRSRAARGAGAQGGDRLSARRRHRGDKAHSRRRRSRRRELRRGLGASRAQPRVGTRAFARDADRDRRSRSARTFRSFCSARRRSRPASAKSSALSRCRRCGSP